MALTLCVGAKAVIAQRLTVVKEATIKNTGCVIIPDATAPATISGGILNGKGIYIPKPFAVRNSKRHKVHGRVSVQVVIGRDGTIASASGVSGNDRLKPAAESAALLARFKPTLVGGNPVKVIGLIWYTF